MVGAATASPIAGTNLVYVAHMYPEHWKNVQLRAQIGDAAKVFPVAITEWGFETAGNGTVSGTIETYGAPFKQFVRELKLSWTAWCASRSWGPSHVQPGSHPAGGERRDGRLREGLALRRPPARSAGRTLTDGRMPVLISAAAQSHRHQGLPLPPAPPHQGRADALASFLAKGKR